MRQYIVPGSLALNVMSARVLVVSASGVVASSATGAVVSYVTVRSAPSTTVTVLPGMSVTANATLRPTVLRAPTTGIAAARVSLVTCCCRVSAPRMSGGVAAACVGKAASVSLRDDTVALSTDTTTAASPAFAQSSLCNVPEFQTYAGQQVTGRMEVRTGARCSIGMINSNGPTYSSQILARPVYGTVTMNGPRTVSALFAGGAGDKVALPGFGSFQKSHRAAREGRNPQTGETIQIKASNGVKFSAATGFKSAVN